MATSAVDVESLNRRQLNGADLRTVVKNQVDVVLAKISATPQTWGLNVMTAPLLTTFTIPGIEDKGMIQRFVYSAVIQDLEARGFEVQICFVDADHTILVVKWMLAFDESELRRMDKYIKDHVAAKADIDKLLKERARG